MKKRVILAFMLAAAFAVGYGAVADAWPDGGDAPFRGYFRNQLDTAGDHVWRPNTGPSSCRGNSNALPTWVNTKSEFISFVKCKLNNGNAQERVGAAFIIQTMRGGNSTTNPPSSSQIADWEARVNNPSVNVLWNTNRSYTINTYYQGCCGGGSNPVDDAYYNDNGSGSSIVFQVPGQDYVIRRQCANPVGNGSLGELPPGQDFNMEGHTEINRTEVLPGQQITWRHFLENAGNTSTSPTTINWRVYNSLTGGQTLNGNAGTFAKDQEKMVRSHTLTVPASATPGTQYCRHVWWSPNTENGGSQSGSPACATVQYDFDLEPRIEFTITDVDGQDVTADGVAEAGFTIEFEYRVRNDGLTESQSANCTYRRDAHGGYNTSAPTQVFTPPGASCPPATAFPRNSNTQIATETISGGDVATNTTICRSLTIAPATQDGGSEVVQSCIPVVAKPYTRVYGGDVSTGNAFAGEPNVCSNFDEASIVSWNRRPAGSFAGAGAQYAALALDAINDFSTDLGNSGSDAPDGLSFANNSVPVDENDGEFGGFFGDVPCIANYYAERPDDGQVIGASPNLSSLGASGEHIEYVRNGSLTLNGGNINPDEQTTIYVDGNVFIGGNIDYPGSWGAGNVPVFRLIVNGNIYIGQNVSQLDGLYVAQGNGTSGGVIYTCATGLNSPVSQTAGNFYDQCNTKLTVNGSFVATQVRLLRNNGTLSQSSVDDYPPGTGQVGEVFNYNPTMWLNQPPLSSGAQGDYDAVISLPPIL